MSLPETERAAFLRRLSERLDAESGDATDVEWTTELERRAEEVLAGTAVTVDGEAFLEQLLAHPPRG